MQWVVGTGRTIEEAKEAALDQLGVDEADADFEILDEPRRGIFGLGASEARVRARVRPHIPRPKVGRRRRREQGGDGRGGTARDGGESAGERAEGQSGGAGPGGSGERERRGGAVVEDLSAQAEIARTFMSGLVRAFGLHASVAASVGEDGTVVVTVDDTPEGPGARSGLGVLIGPRGQTLDALTELVRTVVARRAPGQAARIVVDVAGYRQRRREALERFIRQVAEEVRTTGVPKALEPMGPADRKVVHDTVNTVPGVTTRSEGAEPRRRVVIVPAGD
jgi:spoIIIJ-associated protein